LFDQLAAIMKRFLVVDAASAVVIIVAAVAILGPNARQSSAFVPVRTTHVPVRTTSTTQQTSFHHVMFPLFGILDDMRAAEKRSDDTPVVAAHADAVDTSGEAMLLANHPAFQTLYHDLIFATDLSRQITKKLNECTHPEFLDFLHSLQQCTNVETERQGLAELIDTIRASETKCHAEDEAQQVKASTRVGKEDVIIRLQQAGDDKDKPPEPSSSRTVTNDVGVLSNADIIKRANQIDKAVAAAALSDDEKPSDFISDCRDVVNLSRGFNNQGQMRVGGR
jgi:hypothetical protein